MTNGDPTTPDPRWEFRTWGDLVEPRKTLERVASAVEQDSMRDDYLIGVDPLVSAKIRQGALQVKHCLDHQGDLQLWVPAWEVSAPFEPDSVARLLGELGLDGPSAQSAELVLPMGPDALEVQLAHLPDGHWVRAAKQRTRYDLDGTLAEATSVRFDGASATWSIAIEGTDPDQVTELRDTLGLTEHSNIPMHVAATAAGTAPE